jgi:hypothetical protein
MSTPPPPVPTVDLPQEPVQLGLSEPARIVDTFIAPRKVFDDIRKNQSWWVPWLLSSLLFTAFFYTVDKKIGFDTITEIQVSRATGFMKRALDQMPPEKRQSAVERQAKGLRVGTLYLSWLNVLIAGLVVAGLLMATFNFGFGAEIKYREALSATFYAYLPRILLAILGMITLFAGVNPDGFDLENPVATNLAAFLDPSSSSKFLYRLLGGIDVLAIWVVILLGIGFSRLCRKKVSTGSAVAAVAVWYAVYVLGRAGLALIFG